MYESLDMVGRKAEVSSRELSWTTPVRITSAIAAYATDEYVDLSRSVEGAKLTDERGWCC